MLPRNNHDAMAIVWLVLGISVTVTAITMVMAIVFNQPLANISGNPAIAQWLYFLPLSLMLHGIHQSATFYSNRNKHFGLIARSTILQYTVLNTIRIAAGWLKTAFNGLITGQLFAQLFSTVYMATRVLKRIKETANNADSHLEAGSSEDTPGSSPAISHPSYDAIRKQAVLYSGYPKFNMPLNVTNNLSGALPIFMLTWGFSPAIAGLYAFGFTFVFRPIGLFSQSTMQVLSQKIIENHHHGKPIYPPLKKLVTRLLLLAIMPVAALAFFAPSVFSLVFSDDYTLSGSILQYLSPYLLMVFITSPLAFIPELFFRQKKAMIIDIIYLILRFVALGAGITANSLPLAIALFSASGTLVVGYNLFWYLSLAKHGDTSFERCPQAEQQKPTKS